MSMELGKIIAMIPDFLTWKQVEQIKFFAWYAHKHRGMETFETNDISCSFDEIHLGRPANVSSVLASLEGRKPQEILRIGKKFKLGARVRTDFDTRFGTRESTTHVDHLLTSLPAQLADDAQKVYLEEAITCFRHKANRAALVMTWNLAYDHVCRWIVRNHLAQFNGQLKLSFPKAKIQNIAKLEDFEFLFEGETLQVCKSATLMSPNIYKILKEKLDRRNMVAHPSNVTIHDNTVEEFIKDLVENIIMKLK